MSIIIKKINRVYNRYMQRNANFLFRSIINTPPASVKTDAKTVLYCALSKNACRQYIAMVKSFLRYTQNVDVVAQDDGTLANKHIKEIEAHIKGVKIFRKNEMLDLIREEAGADLLTLLPGEDAYLDLISVKIMYLKFLNVIFRFNGRKVIIVDSDILFLKRPNEIIDWIEQPYSYDFYGEGGNAKAQDFYNMGFQFENLDIANFSSGTLGIGGTVSRENLIDIFSRIIAYNPSLFNAWEIEQALWSVIMAERPNPLNLDELREIYIGSGWRPYKRLKEEAVIAHFAGAVRFKNFRYIKLLGLVVKELQSNDLMSR